MTEDEKKQIVGEVKAELAKTSRNLRGAPEVSDLDGVSSLPAIRVKEDGTREMVRVRVKTLQQPVSDAADVALEAAAEARKAIDEVSGFADLGAESIRDFEQKGRDALAALDEDSKTAKEIVKDMEGRSGDVLRLFTEAKAFSETAKAQLENAGSKALKEAASATLAAEKANKAARDIDDALAEDRQLAQDAANAAKSAADCKTSADAAIAAANEAKTAAVEALSGVGDAVSNAQTAADNANKATLNAQAAADAANEAVTTIGTAISEATSSVGDATTAANNAAANATAAAQSALAAERMVDNLNATADGEGNVTVTLERGDGQTLSTSFKAGGDGKVKTISVKGGDTFEPDTAGNVELEIPEQVTVDDSLDDSSNAVQNRVVKAAIDELKGKAVSGIEVEVLDNGNNVINLTDEKGQPIATSNEFAAGGGGDSSATRIVLSAAVDKTLIQEGGSAKVTYTYDHVDAENVSTGARATITITATKGSTTLLSTEIKNVGSGTYDFDLTKYLSVGTVDVKVLAEVATEDGGTQKKSRMTSITVAQLILTSGYDLKNTITNGGYSDSDTIEIPYTIQGAGTKVVNMYIDGNTTPTSNAGITNNKVNGQFLILGSTLSAGRHVIQLVAQRVTSEGDVELTSQSIHIDILKQGADAPFVGVKYTDPTGTIRKNSYQTPGMKVEQYANLEFDWVAYDPQNSVASVEEKQGAQTMRTMSVEREVQHYQSRFTESGTVNLQLVCGEAQYNASVTVAASKVSVTEAKGGLVFKLSPNGRSNSESEEARKTWENNGVSVDFEKVAWTDACGWTDGTLKLTNGAKATIGYQPFAKSVKQSGLTIEMEFKMSNAADRTSAIISCMDGMGFEVTTEEAAMYTGSTQTIHPDPDDDSYTEEVKVGTSMKFGADNWYKVAFVMHKSDSRLMELYINGIRSKADLYASGDTMVQEHPQNIVIDSANADVELRNIRVYSRALEDDECVDNYIVDHTDLDEMLALYEKNDVMDAQNEVSIDSLIERGKGAILVVRGGGLEPVNIANDKKADFNCDKVIIYTPWGDVIELRGCIMRIQGTSSTKYPRKNYRFYSAKGNGEVWIKKAGQAVFEQVGNRLFPMMENDAHPVKVATAKADYSDSSMTHNTGLAQVWNDTTKAMGILTPPQQKDRTYRTSVYGYPCDIFSAETENGERTYWGQYNLNHDKSNWESIIGLKGVDGIDNSKVMCLEFLNNSFDLGNFRMKSDVDAQFDAEFKDALEFNWPKDTYWTQAEVDKNEGSKLANDYQKTAIKDLWKWVKACVPQTADTTEYKNIGSFASEKFKSEAAQHFNVRNLLAWYIFTDYHVMVDQRVKNMMWQTWDGTTWWLNYYDGDTALLLDNTSFLKYLYTVDREFYDEKSKKYAFEGHNSVLWCLVLANFGDELKTVAGDMRAQMSIRKGSGTVNVMDILNNRQMGNWSERQYNKSGELKYIYPLVTGVKVGSETQKYNYIYALQGSREAHRTHTLVNRYALLDAKYQTSAFRSDAVELYVNRDSGGESKVKLTSADLYYFGYGTKNSPNLVPSVEAKEDDVVELTLTQSFTQNDPVSVYGASRMRKLDLTGLNGEIVGSNKFGKCKLLRELTMRTENGVVNTGFVDGDDFASCTQLRVLDVYGQTNFSTDGKNDLNLTAQTRLERLDAGHTTVKTVELASGAPIAYLRLPATLTTLRLEHLAALTDENLVMEGTDNVTTFVFDSCPGVDVMALFEKCTAVKNVRIAGFEGEGDGDVLRRMKQNGAKGIDAQGGVTDKPQIKGVYKLTKYAEDLEELSSFFEGLEIRQSPYTMVSYRTDVASSVCVKNEENGTGYPSSTYQLSGHVKKLVDECCYCVAKKTNEAIAIEYVERTYYPLQEDDMTKYADGGTALLDGSQGAWMSFIPHHWEKGVNDYLGKKNYACISMNKEQPPVSDKTQTLKLEDVSVSGAFATIAVAGWKKVRYGTAVCGTAKFENASGVQVGDTITTSEEDFADGMYVIADVPDGAVRLVAMLPTDKSEYKVVLSNSERIEDMEDEWVEFKAALYSTYVVSDPVDYNKEVEHLFSSVVLRNDRYSCYKQSNPSQVSSIEECMYHVFSLREVYELALLNILRYGTMAMNSTTPWLAKVEQGYSPSGGPIYIGEGRKEFNYVRKDGTMNATLPAYHRSGGTARYFSHLKWGKNMDMLAVGSMEGTSGTYMRSYSTNDNTDIYTAMFGWSSQYLGLIGLRSNTKNYVRASYKVYFQPNDSSLIKKASSSEAFLGLTDHQK